MYIHTTHYTLLIYSKNREGKVSVHLVRNGLQWIRDYFRTRERGREVERYGNPIGCNWHVFEVW